MKSYDRLFGSGPRGALFSTVFFIIAWQLEGQLGLPDIIETATYRWACILLLGAAGIAVIGWSLLALPPGERGRKLVTDGPFHYFRHPLYAAFVVYLYPAFALWLNNWIYLGWAVLMYPLWSLNVAREEKLMLSEFGEEYQSYCQRSGKFLPRLL